MARLRAVLFMALVISVFATSIKATTTYTVGDTNGWALGVDYGTWATGKTFKIGDSLVFNYGSSHLVSEVSSSDYNSCSSSNALTADRSGATTITLKTPGQHYFVCGIPGHCDVGQKLVVTVSGAAETATPSGGSTIAPSSVSTTLEAPTTTTNAPTTSTTNNDVPHSSSASSLSSIATIFFVACGVVVSGFIV